MVAGQVGGSPLTGVDQRAQSRVGARHVVGAQRGAQRGVHGVEQEAHLGRRRFRLIGNRTWRVFVGQPQIDPAQLLGHGEHKAVDLPGYRNSQCGNRIAERSGVEHQMRAAAGAQLDRGVDLTGPHSRRIDHHAGGQFECLPRQLVGQLHRTAGGRGGRHPGQDPAPCARRCVPPRRPAGRRRSAARRRPATRRRARRGGRSGPSRPPAAHRSDGTAAGSRTWVPASMRSPSPATNPIRTKARWRGSWTAAAEPTAAWRAPDGSVAGHQDAALHSAAPRDADVARGQIAQPPCTSLELHRLVPNARSCFSTSTTDSPRLAASRAIPVPVMPPPMRRRRCVRCPRVRPGRRPGGRR